MANFIVWQVVIELFHFLTGQKMLRGIKNRTEVEQPQGRQSTREPI